MDEYAKTIAPAPLSRARGSPMLEIALPAGNTVPESFMLCLICINPHTTTVIANTKQVVTLMVEIYLREFIFSSKQNGSAIARNTI